MDVRYLNEEKILERAEDESEALVHVGENTLDIFSAKLDLLAKEINLIHLQRR